MDYDIATKRLLDEICKEKGIDQFQDSFDREILVGIALERLGFHEEAKAMTAVGRPKKGELSRSMTLSIMQNSKNPALRYLAFVAQPTRTPNSMNQRWLFRLVQQLMLSGLSRDQAAWKLHKQLKGFEYKDISKAYDRELKKLKKI